MCTRSFGGIATGMSAGSRRPQVGGFARNMPPTSQHWSVPGTMACLEGYSVTVMQDVFDYEDVF